MIFYSIVRQLNSNAIDLHISYEGQYIVYPIRSSNILGEYVRFALSVGSSSVGVIYFNYFPRTESLFRIIEEHGSTITGESIVRIDHDDFCRRRDSDRQSLWYSSPSDFRLGSFYTDSSVTSTKAKVKRNLPSWW